MDDAAAFMELVRSNSQSELTPLERGMHALKSGTSVRDYADKVARSKSSVGREAAAAEVAVACPNVGTVGDKTIHLADLREQLAWHRLPWWRRWWG